MITPPTRPKTRRNLRALIAIGFALALAASVTGIIILTLSLGPAAGGRSTSLTGQYVLLLGLAHLVVYAGIFLQVRKLMNRPA